MFLSQFSDPLFSGPPFYFILSSPFHLYPPCVDQIVSVDPYPISTFLKSLGSSCKAKNHCSGSSCRAFNVVAAAFHQIFHSFPLSSSFLILILIRGMVQNVALDGRPHLLTSALLSRGSIPPRTALLDDHDQTSPLYLLTWILMTVFAHSRTTYCPRIGPLAQYIHTYVLLGLSPLQIAIIIFLVSNIICSYL